MNQVAERTRIVEALYTRRSTSFNGGFVDVATLARELSIDARRVAYICRDLVLHRHVIGDGNLMGRVRLSDEGVAYVERVREMAL